MKEFVYIFALLVLLLAASTVQSEEEVITDTIYSGIPKEYDIGGNHYNVDLIVLSGYESRAVYKINEEIKRLNLHETISLDENVQLRLDEVLEIAYQERTVISFILLTSCGNGVCDTEETCSSCVQDCACQLGYVCQSNQCLEEVICGDDKCSLQETCASDNCCNGALYDLDLDRSNCGLCGNACPSNKDCVSGVCTNLSEYCGNEVCETNEEKVCKADCKWCGDGKCNGDENYKNCQQDCERPITCGDNICDNNENCCLDCGCDIGFQCIDNSCAPDYECKSDLDCDANNTCVDNECVLTQKTSQESKPLPSDLTVNLTDNITTHNETNKDPVEEEKSIWQTVLGWFSSLFG